ncbi:MAG: hypothetical protein ACOX52_15580 [Verrucomicrobiota bacterium]
MDRDGIPDPDGEFTGLADEFLAVHNTLALGADINEHHVFIHIGDDPLHLLARLETGHKVFEAVLEQGCKIFQISSFRIRHSGRPSKQSHTIYSVCEHSAFSGR